ncbi:MAG: hypothetical protein AMS22_10970 [Thiotrichales bacterium SG8_50]|nr:MAG: hypothetical protein AMS22_10970 [Thiotrichales bacterium SG8_50]
MRRLATICTSCIVVSLILTGQTYAKVDPETVVGIWLFDDGGGDVAEDSSGNGNDGTLVGPQWTSDSKFGGALDFDGAGSYIEFATGQNMKTQHLTFMAWFNTRKLDGYGHIFQTGNDWDDMAGCVFRVHQDGYAQSALAFGPANTATWLNGPALEADRWYHMVLTYDGTTALLYLDGVEVASGGGQGEIIYDNQPVRIGVLSNAIGSAFDGFIDEVALFNVALPVEDIEAIMNNGLARIIGDQPFASRPDPKDGAVLNDTWVNLSWSPGNFAASHDVYLGDNPIDVTQATRDSDLFRGNQRDTLALAGFPGFPYPDGLVPGTAYYWRIDEINDSEPNSPWPGPLWSFTVPPRTAHNPTVSDGAVFVAPDVQLGWTSGFGAKLHTVYFGETFDEVDNASGGAPQAGTTFTPGALELEKTYYWRVDELDPPAVHKGDTWSFTTTLPGLGKATAERWENITTTDINTLKINPRFPDNPDVTEDVTEFAWDGPDLSDYGGRLEAWLYVPSTGDFMFWLNSDDQGELWLSTDDDPGNARLIAQESSWSDLDSWYDGEERSDPIPLVGGEKYYIMAIWKEGSGGDHCQVAWQGPGVPQRSVIAGTNLSPFEPLSAYGAKPSNRSTGVTLVPTLTWKPGLQAASHELYFGTDEQAVADATKASPEYKASRQLGDESFDPGKLVWNSTYYWRVDEIDSANPNSPWVGNVWGFTTADFLIVDDFESYDDIDPAPGEPGLNRIFDKWIDGYGTLTNGAIVGNPMPPYAEQTIVHGGAQSMNYAYDNAGKTSEATLTLVYPRDWTEQGVAKLSLWINGSADNAADRIYVALNGTAVVYHEDGSATQIEEWTEWVIDLSAFGGFGVNLANVNSVTIGVGTKNAPSPSGGTGTMYFDDIRLYR